MYSVSIRYRAGQYAPLVADKGFNLRVAHVTADEVVAMSPAHIEGVARVVLRQGDHFQRLNPTMVSEISIKYDGVVIDHIDWSRENSPDFPKERLFNPEQSPVSRDTIDPGS